MISVGLRMRVLAVAVCVVGTVGACGGASPAPAGSSSAPGPTSAAAAGGSAEQFCTVVRQQKTLLLGTQLPTLLASGTPATWKEFLDQTAAMNQQLVDAAPPEIKPSVKTLQDGTLTLKSTLEAANYDPSKVGSAKLIQLMQTPERLAATTTLVTYVKTNCGIDLTKAGG